MERVAGSRWTAPSSPEHGDYATNAALVLAKGAGKPPREVAEELAGGLRDELGPALADVQVAGPGFLNLFLSDQWYADAVARVLAEGASFGEGHPEQRLRVLVEFVSANPTGPLTAASGRHAAYGDGLARLLTLAGHDVEREYYFNDAGTQIRKLGESIRARARGEEIPEDGYEGDYVAELADEIPDAATRDPDDLAAEGVERMFARIKATLTAYGVEYDSYFNERSLHLGDPSPIEAALAKLEERGLTFEKDGALWLRTTDFGEDQDRVLRRSSGETTYFAADVAYHTEKLERGYDQLVNVLGADHHGYVPRMKALVTILCGDPQRLEIPLLQFVHLVEGDERSSMSKRRGDFVTLGRADRRDRRGRHAVLHAPALARLDDRPRLGPGQGAVAASRPVALFTPEGSTITAPLLKITWSSRPSSRIVSQHGRLVRLPGGDDHAADRDRRHARAVELCDECLGRRLGERLFPCGRRPVEQRAVLGHDAIEQVELGKTARAARRSSRPVTMISLRPDARSRSSAATVGSSTLAVGGERAVVVGGEGVVAHGRS